MPRTSPRHLPCGSWFESPLSIAAFVRAPTARWARGHFRQARHTDSVRRVGCAARSRRQRSSARSAELSWRRATARMNATPVVCGWVMTLGIVAATDGVRGGGSAPTPRTALSAIAMTPITPTENRAPRRIGAPAGALRPATARRELERQGTPGAPHYVEFVRSDLRMHAYWWLRADATRMAKRDGISLTALRGAPKRVMVNLMVGVRSEDDLRTVYPWHLPGSAPLR